MRGNYCLCLLLSLAAVIGGSHRVAAAELEAGPREVTLRLKWFHQFQFAGFYAAVEKGFFADNGLSVKILERDPATSVVDDVVSGAVDFGVADSSLIVARMNGKPVVLVSPIYQHSPLVLMSLAENGIFSPAELKGKRVMFQQDIDDAAVVATLNAMGVREADIIPIEHSFNDWALVEDYVDAMSVYLSNQPYLYREKGIPVNIINPANYGVDLYGDMIFTSESMVRDSPELVKAFGEASRRGWDYALRNPQEIIDLILRKYSSRQTTDKLAYEAQVIAQMVSPDLVEIGTFTKARFNTIGEIYRLRGRVPLYGNLDGFFLDEYETGLDYTLIFGGITGIATILLVLLIALNKRLNKLAAGRTRELLETKRQLQRYMDIINRYTCTYRVNKKLEFSDVSVALCEVTGFSADQLVGKPHNFLFHDQNSPDLLNSLLGNVYFGRKWQGEVLQKSKSGDTLTMDTFIEPTLDEAGEVDGYTAVQLDITQRKQVEVLSVTDNLTKLYNRRKIESQISVEIKRVSRGGNSFSILLLDIDYFKNINDKYGHGVGDEVLRSFAQLLTLHSRATDTVGRWGGEEFCILCPCTSFVQAKSFAEKLREAVDKQVFPQVAKITVSIGVTEYIQGENAARLFDRVDEALYEAKGAGRNRVMGRPPVAAIENCRRA